MSVKKSISNKNSPYIKSIKRVFVYGNEEEIASPSTEKKGVLSHLVIAKSNQNINEGKGESLPLINMQMG